MSQASTTVFTRLVVAEILTYTNTAVHQSRILSLITTEFARIATWTLAHCSKRRLVRDTRAAVHANVGANSTIVWWNIELPKIQWKIRLGSIATSSNKSASASALIRQPTGQEVEFIINRRERPSIQGTSTIVLAWVGKASRNGRCHLTAVGAIIRILASTLPSIVTAARVDSGIRRVGFDRH